MMKKLMKGYEQAKKIRRREGEPFNHRPINTTLKRKARRGLVFDKRRRMWVKRGGR